VFNQTDLFIDYKIKGGKWITLSFNDLDSVFDCSESIKVCDGEEIIEFDLESNSGLINRVFSQISFLKNLDPAVKKEAIEFPYRYTCKSNLKLTR